jgi:MFS family permease
VSSAPAHRPPGLLRRNPGFRALFAAIFASGLGTFIAVIALSVDVYDRTGSATWVSALLVADFLPSVAIGLLFGPLIDRLSRRRIMVVADLARLGIFVALPFTDSPQEIVILAAAAGFATGFFRPASYAGLPNVVLAPDLPAANSLLRAGEYLSWTVGGALGGLVVASSRRPSSSASRPRCSRGRRRSHGATGTTWATASRWSSGPACCWPSSARGTS